MAFLQVQFYAKTLRVAAMANVILPENEQGIGINAGEEETLPQVLYLLHGYSDDHSIWMRRTSVERYAAEKNLAIIMPAVNHSFYLNEAHGERYWDFVSEELPKTMHRFFRLSNKAEDTFVAGLSMGGYGAMKLALTYPERYEAAGCFSGMVDMVEALKDERRGDMLKRLFDDPDSVSGSDADLFHLLEKNADAPHKPRLLVACGTNDHLYEMHKRFVPALKANGWDVHGQEKPDIGHEWAYWDELVRQFIETYC